MLDYPWLLSDRDNISLEFLEGWRKYVPQRLMVKMCVEYLICQDFCRKVCVVKFLCVLVYVRVYVRVRVRRRGRRRVRAPTL